MERSDYEFGNLPDRIKKIREYFCNGNNLLFSEKIGKSPQVASSLCTGKDNAGKQTIEKILTAFPQVSRAWLMLGDGYMLTEDNIKHNDPSLHLPSESNKDKMNTPAHICEDYITIPLAAWTVIQQQAASLAAKDAILASQSSQIDRMLDLLEKKKQAPSLTTLLTSLETSEK